MACGNSPNKNGGASFAGAPPYLFMQPCMLYIAIVKAIRYSRSSRIRFARLMFRTSCQGKRPRRATFGTSRLCRDDPQDKLRRTT